MRAFGLLSCFIIYGKLYPKGLVCFEATLLFQVTSPYVGFSPCRYSAAYNRCFRNSTPPITRRLRSFVSDLFIALFDLVRLLYTHYRCMSIDIIHKLYTYFLCITCTRFWCLFLEIYFFITWIECINMLYYLYKNGESLY